MVLLSLSAGQIMAQGMSNSDQDPASFWTPERMRNAKPMDDDMMKVPGDPHPEAAPAPQGQPGMVGGSLPGQKTMMEVPPALLDRERSTPQPANWALYPGPNTTFEYFPSYRTYPVSTIGRLFIRTGGGGTTWCTATVVTGSPARNTIWTAGHCTSAGDGTNWYDEFLFCPSYDTRVDPTLGCWPFLNVNVPNEWFARHAWSRDFAIISLQHSGTVINEDVADVTGGLGFAWNLPRRQNWIHMGYPGNWPFNGQRLIWTGAERTFDDPIDTIGPPANSWGSPQGGGSSGSAVVSSFEFSRGQNGGGYINSDVAYYYTSHPNQLQGPYFDTRVCNFWKSFTGATVTC